MPPDSGADDLLPILSFVALRSGLPQLVSECAALEEFIHERWVHAACSPCPAPSPAAPTPRGAPVSGFPGAGSPCSPSSDSPACTQVPDRRGGLLPDVAAERPELLGAAAPGGPGQVEDGVGAAAVGFLPPPQSSRRPLHS